MFCHHTWAVGSYSSGPPAARTVGSLSTGGFTDKFGHPVCYVCSVFTICTYLVLILCCNVVPKVPNPSKQRVLAVKADVTGDTETLDAALSAATTELGPVRIHSHNLDLGSDLKTLR